jgi:hypothetical protein
MSIFKGEESYLKISYKRTVTHSLFGGANETKLKGGNLCIKGTCTMEGKAVEGKPPVKIQCALHM